MSTAIQDFDSNVSAAIDFLTHKVNWALVNWIKGLIRARLASAPLTDDDAFNELSLFDKLDFFVTFLNTRNSSSLFTRDFDQPTMTTKITLHDLLDLRSYMEKQVFSGTLLSLGIRIGMPLAPITDWRGVTYWEGPSVVLIVAHAAKEVLCQPPLVPRRITRVKMRETQLIPRCVDDMDVDCEECDREGETFSIPLGHLFHSLDSRFGTSFLDHMRDWEIKVDIPMLHSLIMKQFQIYSSRHDFLIN